MIKTNVILILLTLFISGCEKIDTASQYSAGDNPSSPMEAPLKEQKSPVTSEKNTLASDEHIPSTILTETSSSALTSIKGIVRYEGPVPKFKEISMDADPICLTKHAEAVLPQTLILGEGQTMANVFVHITQGLAKKNYPTPSEAASITQQGCMYNPHVLAVMVGQPIRILNPDGTLHNVHAMPKINAEFNLAMPKFRTETTQTFDKPEFMFPMKCDVHPWMGAWISVMDHPFFEVTKKDGTFSINNLPAGQYEISAWHEKLGTLKQTIRIMTGEVKSVDFTFARPQ